MTQDYDYPGFLKRNRKVKKKNIIKANYSIILITALSLLVIGSALLAPFVALAYMKAQTGHNIPHITQEDMKSPFLDNEDPLCELLTVECQ